MLAQLVRRLSDVLPERRVRGPDQFVVDGLRFDRAVRGLDRRGIEVFAAPLPAAVVGVVLPLLPVADELVSAARRYDVAAARSAVRVVSAASIRSRVNRRSSATCRAWCGQTLVTNTSSWFGPQASMYTAPATSRVCVAVALFDLPLLSPFDLGRRRRPARRRAHAVTVASTRK